MILVVEDHDDTRRYLVLLLTKQGYRVRSAGTADEALIMARDLPPKLFILDQQMPDMTGLELQERIAVEQTLAGSKVIFYSASFDPGTARRALDAGAMEWLVKGVHGANHVLAAVARAFAPC